MKAKQFHLLLVLIFLLAFRLPSRAQGTEQVSLINFTLQSDAVVHASGKELSSPDYHSKAYWFPVTVPSTVLTGLVQNKVYPDPYQGLNNMYIPDASDSFNLIYDLGKFSHIPHITNPWKYPYWYRTQFTVDHKDPSNTYELLFKGINYRAEVWLNGSLIADSSEMAGMFAEYRLNVSRSLTEGTNYLAVKIFPLDDPGFPSPEQLEALGDFYPNGGPTGDIGKNVTMLCSVGWDWMPPVRDRNMGIWRPVYLRTSGPATIIEPKIVTDLPGLPDTSKVEFELSFGLKNHSASKIKGNAHILIKPQNFKGTSIHFNDPIKLKPNGYKKLTYSSTKIKELILKDPRLWWPLGYGRPNLYTVEISFQTEDGVIDHTKQTFGIRKVTTTTSKEENFVRRDFYVNGRRIFLQGGAWVPDMMVNRDSLKLAREIKLCANANINLLRIWGGGVTPSDDFFELADRYGLLVWSDFWVTGDTQGEFKGSPDWPLEGDVFRKNFTSTILRIRNHPSLFLWTGGNEGHARKELYDAMRDSIIALDGTRPFIPSSSGFAKLPNGWNGSWPDNGPSGVYSSGPYQWTDPQIYYKKSEQGRDWVFKDETGIPSQPPLNSLVKIIPDLIWDTTRVYPMNDSWGYHDAATGNGRYDRYYDEMVNRYGSPTSMEDFSSKLQLMNAMGYQGIFEAAQHKLNQTGGIMLWKLNAAFPSVIWQVYDWYLQPNAGYYFMQNACEPLHIQLNLNDSTVAVVNRHHQPFEDLTAAIDVYDIQGKLVFHKSVTLSVGQESVKETEPLKRIMSNQNSLLFVLLHLKNAEGKIVSRNTYWFQPGHDYSSLNSMGSASIMVKLVSKEANGNDKQWGFEITNNSNEVAFFIRPRFMSGGKEVLPSYWSAGYFTLMPEEKQVVNVTVEKGLLGKDATAVHFSGWNVPMESVILPIKKGGDN